MLIAADQEGGQLNALGDGPTPFAGPMALGAAGDEDLAERVAGATAIELRALGVNVNYAPVCDLADNPANPALGIRSFGDDPDAVGTLAAATVRGLQDHGVAATAKHFPGAGDTAADPHHELPLVPARDAELAERELVPFRAALDAGARLVMTGHFALAGQGDDLPTSLSAPVLRGLLREQLRFDGVTVTDALDMRALAQGSAQIVDAIAALRAGEDLLLGTPDEPALRTAGGGPRAGGAARPDRCRRRRRGETPAGRPAPLAGRVRPAIARRRRLRRTPGARRRAGPAVAHPRAQRRPSVAVDAGRRRADRGRPVDARRVDAGRHSSTVPPTLASALRRRLPGVDEILLPVAPGEADIAGLGDRLADFDLVIVGTFAAHLQPAQAALAAAVLASGKPTVTVALRTPWDLLAYPSARTHVCSYGILPPSMEALAAALLGEVPFAGRLPVDIAGLHPRGHGLVAWG